LLPLGLTPREAEVLYWVSQGKTNPEIGLILAVSVATVKKHVEHIFEKIGVENRSAAILRVIDFCGRHEG
jgi:DNA-binding CsgD family transcriptional regulator